MKSRWPILLGTVLLVPAALFVAWAVLTFGGAIDEQLAEEERRAQTALSEFRTAFATALHGVPYAKPAALREVGHEKLGATARIGLEFEAHGAASQALAYFNRVPAPLPLPVLLAKARALLALRRIQQATRLLTVELAPHSALDGVPVALSVAILRAHASQPQAVWQQVLAGDLAVPPVYAVQLIEALRECGAGLDEAAVADFLWAARARQTLDLDLDLGLLEREGTGEIAALPGGGLFLRERRQLVSPDRVAAAEASASQVIARRFGVTVGSDQGGVDALAKVAFAGQRWVASIAASARGSTRLQWVAATCLGLALAAFLLGNLVLWWLARRTAALSRLKTDFIDVVSHELRTPLTALSVRSEMLANGDVPAAKVGDYQRSLYQEVHRLSGLVHDVLDFGRLERGRDLLNPHPVSVRVLVAKAVRASRDAVRLGRQRLAVDVPRQLPELFVDVEVLVRALRNLIDNATVHAPEQSAIELTASGGPDGVVFVVSDRGAGLGGADPQKLFEPFRKGASNRRGGSGLGLAIVDSAARAHGGRVQAAERRGGGAEFRIELPVRGRPS